MQEVKQKMIGKKILIVAMLLIAMVGTASAAITLTVNTPTDAQLFRPNLDGETYVDLNITFVDSTATNSIHTLGIQYATADGNVYMNTDSNATQPGTDLNMSSSNCSFAVANVWTTPGADCIIRYTFPTNPQIATGTYAMDVNGTAYDAEGLITATTSTVRVFSIDNRWINSAVEALLVIIPIVLIAALIIGIVLVGFGVISGQTVLILAVGAVVSIIAVIVLSGIMGVLTP